MPILTQAQMRANGDALLVITTDIATPALSFYDGWDWTTLKYFLQSVSRELLDHNRLSACLRVMSPAARTVDVHRSEDGKQAHYQNLVRCANVWICPICTDTISHRRMIELAESLHNSTTVPVMMTLTMSHHRYMPLKESVTTLTAAYRRFVAGKGYGLLADKFAIRGAVKALEFTYGLNGWHPHFHVLLICDHENDLADMEQEFAPRWERMVEREGGTLSRRYGLDLKQADDAVSEYIIKHGRNPKGESSAEYEVTRNTTKRGKSGNLSVLELLMVAGSLDAAPAARERACELWVEYFVATKGKHQLQWSRGLKDHLQVTPVDDSEIVVSEGVDMPLFAQIERRAWEKIVRNDARATVLNLAKDGDSRALWAFINSLPDRAEGTLS